MNMKACSVTISRWKTAQPKCNGNCQMPSNAIRINISSPANKLPNNRSDRDKGFANNETDSRIKLKEMIKSFVKIRGDNFSNIKDIILE